MSVIAWSGHLYPGWPKNKVQISSCSPYIILSEPYLVEVTKIWFKHCQFFKLSKSFLSVKLVVLCNERFDEVVFNNIQRRAPPLGELLAWNGCHGRIFSTFWTISKSDKITLTLVHWVIISQRRTGSYFKRNRHLSGNIYEPWTWEADTSNLLQKPILTTLLMFTHNS